MQHRALFTATNPLVQTAWKTEPIFEAVASWFSAKLALSRSQLKPQSQLRGENERLMIIIVTSLVLSEGDYLGLHRDHLSFGTGMREMILHCVALNGYKDPRQISCPVIVKGGIFRTPKLSLPKKMEYDPESTLPILNGTIPAPPQSRVHT